MNLNCFWIVNKSEVLYLSLNISKCKESETVQSCENSTFYVTCVVLWLFIFWSLKSKFVRKVKISSTNRQDRFRPVFWWWLKHVKCPMLTVPGLLPGHLKVTQQGQCISKARRKSGLEFRFKLLSINYISTFVNAYH